MEKKKKIKKGKVKKNEMLLINDYLHVCPVCSISFLVSNRWPCNHVRYTYGERLCLVTQRGQESKKEKDSAIYSIRAWPNEHDFYTKDICIKIKALSCLRYYMKYIISIILKQAAREAVWANVDSQRTLIAFVLVLFSEILRFPLFHFTPLTRAQW